MRHSFFSKIFGILALMLLSFSCSSDLDFNQVDELNIKPVFTTNLAYLDLKASQFVVNGVEIPILSYPANVDFLNKTIIRDDLIKAELFFKIKNTINKAYIYNITFLDKNNNITYPPIIMNIPASKGGEVVEPEPQTVIFDSSSIDALKNTTKMVFSIVMVPGSGPPLTATSPGNIILSSSLTAYFDIK
jgi:hypothetical protein